LLSRLVSAIASSSSSVSPNVSSTMGLAHFYYG
jgi:hypothetical protein